MLIFMCEDSISKSSLLGGRGDALCMREVVARLCISMR